MSKHWQHTQCTYSMQTTKLTENLTVSTSRTWTKPGRPSRVDQVGWTNIVNIPFTDMSPGVCLQWDCCHYENPELSSLECILYRTGCVSDRTVSAACDTLETNRCVCQLQYMTVNRACWLHVPSDMCPLEMILLCPKYKFQFLYLIFCIVLMR